MKRFGVTLFALAMLTVLAACGGRNGGSVILVTARGESMAQAVPELPDAVFDSEKPTLKEKSPATLKPAPEDLVITNDLAAFAAEQGNGKDRETLEADAREELRQQELTLVSLSPAGNSGILSGEDVKFAMYRGQYRPIYPSAARSVESIGPDTEEPNSLLMYWMSFSNHRYALLSREGFVYSPDGRYAAIPNAGQFFFTERMDPMVIDLSTGELIQTASYGNANVLGAAFSADNRYFCYVLGGGFEGGNRRLCRYDLETGETECCWEGTAKAYFPDLAELQDGSWMMLDPLNTALLTVFRSGDAWAARETLLAEANSTPARLLYSRDSGMACVIWKKGDMQGNAAGTALHVFRPDSGNTGLNRFLCVAKGSHEIVSLSADEYEEAFQDCYMNIKNSRGKIREQFILELFPYELIDEIFMSPDGNYLLMKTRSQETLRDKPVSSLLLVRLPDLAVRDVRGLDPDKIGDSVSGYPMIIEWNTDELIIGTEEGLKIYTLAAGQ